MSAAALLKNLPQAFTPDAAGGTDCIIQFNCSAPVHAIIRNGRCSVADGTAAAPDVTVTMDDDDLVALLKGELNGMAAYMTGRLQVDGDLFLAQRLPSLFDPDKL